MPHSPSNPSSDAPAVLPERQPILVDTPAGFEKMMSEVENQPALALDTESDSLYRYYYRVCLIQLSTEEADYIIDPLRMPSLGPLGALMADPRVEKVFHASENDVLVLKRDFGFQFAHLFDTMIGARILGWRHVGLAALLEEHFGVKLDKRIQLTDWGERPLTQKQLRYAQLDTYYLLALRDLITGQLHQQKRWREAQETFAGLANTNFVEKQFDPDAFWRMKGARDLDPQQAAVLRELYLWRDQKARSLDLPPFKVLDDRTLLRLTIDQPARIAGLGLGRWQTNHLGEELVAALERGRNAPPVRPPRRQIYNGPPPDPAASLRFDRLRAWRARRADERGVDADLIVTNELLHIVARAYPRTLDELKALGLLGPWKLEEYGEELLSAMLD